MVKDLEDEKQRLFSLLPVTETTSKTFLCVVEANALLTTSIGESSYLRYFKQARTYFTRETAFRFLLSYHVSVAQIRRKNSFRNLV